MNTTEKVSQLSSFPFLLWNCRDLLKAVDLLQMPRVAQLLVLPLEEMDSCFKCRGGRSGGGQ